MTQEPISVYLADDHAMVREGLASLIESDPGLNVVGQNGNGMAALGQIRQSKPDVAVIDINMPGLNGLDLCHELAAKGCPTAVLFLTMHAEEHLIAQALANGASGYLLKEAAASQLREAIRTVGSGNLYLGPNIPSSVLQRVASHDTDPYSKLTTRERQVLQLVAEGRTNRQMANALDISVKTVDTHRSHLMQKLNIHNQTSLVKYALRKGIVSLR